VYNAAQQLTDLVPALSAAVSYGYDGNGARTSSTVAATGTDPAAVTSYAYTAAGALASVATPTATVEYTVDGRGLRQSRTVGSDTDDFVWSTMGGLPLLLDDGDRAYLYGPSLTPVAQVDEAGAVEYLHGDLLGSVRTITDGSGAVVGASTFDAFGSRAAHTGAADSTFGFTGGWTDPVTGLVHLRARDYDPVSGQFLSVDPAVDSTRQPYAYTGNAPVQRTDPSGLDFVQDLYDGALGAAAAAAAGSDCFLGQAAAFAAGAADSLTMGASSFILGRLLPGYDAFVAGHEAAFTAGSVTVMVIQVAVALVTTLGVGIALIVAKVAAKAALKTAAKTAEKTAVQTAERAGSGPVSGVLEASAGSKSFAALRNYNPRRGVEYVFDPTNGKFAVGRPSAGAGLRGSPHEQLAQSIGANPSTVVGGTLTRGASGIFKTTENSGHFWQNWTNEIRQQFVRTMQGYGFDVVH
jgi:RHS repeat-associated protein